MYQGRGLNIANSHEGNVASIESRESFNRANAVNGAITYRGGVTNTESRKMLQKSPFGAGSKKLSVQINSKGNFLGMNDKMKKTLMNKSP